jgi:hypothetical protein
MAIDLDEAKIARSEPGLWLGWALATAAGMVVGFLIAVLLVNVLDLDLGLSRVLVPLLVGLLVGFAQWLVLRRYMVSSQDWVLAGGAGWAVGYALGLFIVQSMAGSPLGMWIGYILFGILIGLVQWPILRREIPRAFTWVIASLVGWAVGAGLSYLIVNLLITGDQADLTLVAALDAGLTGLFAGLITGLALYWLVRQPDRVVQS